MSSLLVERPFSFLPPDPIAAFVSSLSTDRRLALADVAGSLAHVAALHSAGLITRREAKQLAAALRACLREIHGGVFPWQDSLEDVHTNVEARVIALAGPVGEKLHAGRSRNDQVALDERIDLRLGIESILRRIAVVQEALLRKAKATADAIVPAYTHLQRAQPVLLAHVLLAHVWRLARDAERLHDAFARVNVSPAGAAAVAGTSLPVDPHLVAKLLGFDRTFANSVDATSDRDYYVEVVADLALLAVHLSSLAEDVILWLTREFGLASLAQEHTAGSSLLPNKRNPDVLELVRGQAGPVVGQLVALLATLKGLPLAYNRDLQTGKASAFHALDSVSASLDVLAEVLGGIGFHADAGTPGEAETAVLLVEHIVARGIPYRQAYETVKAHLPAILAAEGDDARLSALRKASRLFDGSALRLLTPSGAVAAIVSPGGTGPVAVRAQIADAEATLGRQAYHLSLIAKKNRRIADLVSGEAAP